MNAEQRKALEEVWIAKMGFDAGWRNIIINKEGDGERIVTGINPVTGRTETLPTLQDLEDELGYKGSELGGDVYIGYIPGTPHGGMNPGKQELN